MEWKPPMPTTREINYALSVLARLRANDCDVTFFINGKPGSAKERRAPPPEQET